MLTLVFDLNSLNMVRPTSQLTFSRAVVIDTHDQHYTIDEAVIKFLEQSIDGIWRRSEEQPSKLMFTKEEWAAFSDCGDIRIVQQAAKRSRLHQELSQLADAKIPAVELDLCEVTISKSDTYREYTFSLDSGRFDVQKSDGKEYNFANSMKLYVENLTGERWDWWPLCPSFRQLRQDEIRIQWYCVSDDPLCLS